MNSHLLALFISYRSCGEKLIKYQANSSRVIMSIILMTTLFYKTLILPGEIWCWSLLGLKGLTGHGLLAFLGSTCSFPKFSSKLSLWEKRLSLAVRILLALIRVDAYRVWKGKRPHLWLASRCSKMPLLKFLIVRMCVPTWIECFHSRGQHLCKCFGTKEIICIRKEFISHRTVLGHQHGRRFIVLGHQYGRRDVMWKHSIRTTYTHVITYGT